jgi:hypothetical protein
VPSRSGGPDLASRYGLTPGRWTPLGADRTVELLVQRLLADFDATQALRVVVDGPRSADVHGWADALVAPLRAAGRPVLRVSADDFWRDASLRLEHGRTDDESYYAGWVDVGALRREVLDPLGPGGDRQVLPSLRDPATNRATRAAKYHCEPNAVVVVDGDLLLGAGLPADLEVHLAQSSAARARRIAADWAWILPAYQRYDDEVRPADLADVTIRVDDPAHPAVRLRPA